MADSPSATTPTDVLLEILRRVLHQLPEGRQITVSDPLVDLGVTSFQLMQIISAAEQSLDIEFPDPALALTTFESVASLAAVVEALAREQSGPVPWQRL